LGLILLILWAAYDSFFSDEFRNMKESGTMISIISFMKFFLWLVGWLILILLLMWAIATGNFIPALIFLLILIWLK
jgi:hypothetical protein